MTVLISLPLLLTACRIVPQKIPDTPGDNVRIEKLRHDMLSNVNSSSGWGWILWYLPILFLVCAWGYKEFFGKRQKCPDDDRKETPKPPKESLESLMTDKNEPSEG